MAARTPKQTVQVEDRSTKTLKFSTGETLSFAANDNGIVVTAPCGEERELTESEARLIDEALDLLTDIIKNDVLMVVYQEFNEILSDNF